MIYLLSNAGKKNDFSWIITITKIHVIVYFKIKLYYNKQLKNAEQNYEYEENVEDVYEDNNEIVRLEFSSASSGDSDIDMSSNDEKSDEDKCYFPNISYQIVFRNNSQAKKQLEPNHVYV